MKEFLTAEGPCFLEVVADREEGVYPVIPQGKSYKDMVLGPSLQGGCGRLRNKFKIQNS